MSAVRIGIAGLGTVGAGVVRILRRQGPLLEQRSGRAIEIVAVNARDRAKDRGVQLSSYDWEDDPVALARRADIDVFVELIGGDEGPAKDAVEAALDAGRDVVTANKALLAVHGRALAERAEANGATIRYEAAVAGGIPCVKALSEGLGANGIERVMGVMNGTCNFILTKMQDEGLPYETVFDEANALGYLEADPTLDVGGIDAAHKLAILSALAFGTAPAFGDVEIEGIERVTIRDIRHAAEMGYRIKLLGVAQMTGRGLEQRMSPCLVPETSPFGQLDGATNMVAFDGDASGRIVMRGAGAGEGPTASAVVADILDIARGLRPPVFGVPVADLTEAKPAQSATPASYYLRLSLPDRPGMLAKVAAALGEAGVSVDRMRQLGHEDETAPVLIVTHKAPRRDVMAALDAMDGILAEPPVALRIEAV